uniref:MYND-type domain-containing protein n=1 Tax=Romanomermis culicivorax TaxID=13658 RepID=A0A915KI52_ROMCU
MTTDHPVQTLTFYPFAYALLDEEVASHCWYCLRETCTTNQLRKCSTCKVALYCDKKCQNLGWSDHVAECKAFLNNKDIVGDCSPTILPVEVRMLARIVWRYKCILKDNKFVSSEGFSLNRSSKRSIMEICDHAEDIRRDSYAIDKFESIYQKLTLCYDKKHICDKETVFQLHCRNFINRHSISDLDYMKEIAKGLFLDLCAYNHSCAPNAVYTCSSFVATLRSLSKDVDLNNISTTFYTYIDLLLSKQLRRKLLSETWYFKCYCTRCSDVNDHLLTSIRCFECNHAIMIFDEKDSLKTEATCNCGHKITEEVINRALILMRSLDTIVSNLPDDNDPKDKLQFLTDLAAKHKHLLHGSNIYYVKIFQSIIGLLDPVRDSSDLLKYHEQSIDCMKLCFPNRHPALAYHFMNMGIFSRRLNDDRRAENYLKQAYDMLKFSLGEDHSMTKKCVDWLEKR